MHDEPEQRITYAEVESVSFVRPDPPVGHYHINAARMAIPVYRKPNWFRRLMMKWLLGIVYKDA